MLLHFFFIAWSYRNCCVMCSSLWHYLLCLVCPEYYYNATPLTGPTTRRILRKTCPLSLYNSPPPPPPHLPLLRPSDALLDTIMERSSEQSFIPQETSPLLQPRPESSVQSTSNFSVNSPVRLLLLIALPFVLFSFVLLQERPIDTSSSISVSHTDSPSALTFLAIGDWGRNGSHTQKQVANAMDKTIHDSTAVHPIIISTGDNFYDGGVETADDESFTNSFEDVYHHPSLKNTAWYAILGNHDHLGRISAQVEYSKLSSRWNMPAPYYSRILAPDLHAIFLDTTPFVNDHYGKSARGKNAQLPNHQLEWLARELQMAPPTARFLLVSHHNMYAMSTHGGTTEVRSAFEPIIAPYASRILAFLSGHVHSLMHMQPQVGRSGVTYDYFVSGGGSKLDDFNTPPPAERRKWEDCCGVLPPASNARGGPRSMWGQKSHGFFIFDFDGTNFSARAVNEEGEIIYEYTKTVPPIM